MGARRARGSATDARGRMSMREARRGGGVLELALEAGLGRGRGFRLRHGPGPAAEAWPAAARPAARGGAAGRTSNGWRGHSRIHGRGARQSRAGRAEPASARARSRSPACARPKSAFGSNRIIPWRGRRRLYESRSAGRPRPFRASASSEHTRRQVYDASPTAPPPARSNSPRAVGAASESSLRARR